MVVKRKKKFRKFRGQRSYGYGSHKKHRGAGNRGGRGKAGMHKHKWSYTVKYDPDRYGKHGFKRPVAVQRKIKAVNLSALDKMAAQLGKTELNMSELGIDKVLGSGKATRGLTVKARYFSKKAVEKLEAAGSKVVVIEAKKKEAPKEVKEESGKEAGEKEVKSEK